MAKSTAGDIMTKKVKTLQTDDNLLKVKGKLGKMKVRHFPVLKGRKLAGIISRTDIMRLSFGNVFDNQEDADNSVFEMLDVSQVMTSKPRTVDVETPIAEVARIFVEEEYHALPVTEGKHGKLAGIVTTTDVIKFYLKKDEKDQKKK